MESSTEETMVKILELISENPQIPIPHLAEEITITSKTGSKMKKQKLELTWIGKDQQPVLEPRILIEDKSYGDPNSSNMLIHGDNLLVLKALEQDFAGKVKCIYIDPPYRTGNAYEKYDDNLEHSIWLSLMEPRIKLLYRLLSVD